MSRLNAYYDRFALRKGFSLRVAFVYTSTYLVLAGLGCFQMRALLENRGEAFYLYMAPLAIVVGFVGLFHGIQVIRAVRRQKGAGAKVSVRG
jgi:uncharacterized membrane protein